MRLNPFCSTLLTLALAASFAIGCADMEDLGDENTSNQEKILGGRNAKAPAWMVSILRNGDIHCGGTLIHKDWVLTAAHCVDIFDKSELTVCVGKNKLSQCRARDKSAISQVKYHRRWNNQNLRGGHDIAVLKLARSFPNRNVSPLARRGDEPASGRKVRALGWGVSDYSKADVTPNRLQRIDLPFISHADCSPIFGGLNNTLVCVDTRGEAGQIARRSVCNGDSGGPIHFNGIQVGLVSFGIVNEQRQCTADGPNVFTRISSFSSWIRNKTNGDVVIP